jgi:hypothetical protein
VASFLGAAAPLFRLTSHEAMTSTESCHAHRKWRDVCFPERTKHEVLSAAARDWLHGGPENKCAPHVIHRELPIIRRISREHLQDRAQDSAIEGNLSLTNGDSHE